MFLVDLVAQFSTIRIKSSNVLRNGKVFFRNAHKRKFEKGLKNIDTNLDAGKLSTRDTDRLFRLQKQGLSKFEAFSIVLYNTTGYRHINNIVKNTKLKQIPETIYALRPLIDRGLRKLPPLKTTSPLSRYVKIDDENVEEFLKLHTTKQPYNTGRTLFENGVMQTNTPYSTGANKDALDIFRNVYSDQTLFEYSIIPKAKSRGKYLEPFLQNGEHEVLFPSKTKFKIRNVDSSRLTTDKIIHIDLGEI